MIEEKSGLDLRRHAVRSDLADARLRDQVDVARFTEGTVWQVVTPVVPVRRRPDERAPRDTEVLFGELVRIFDMRGGWAWVQLESDGYVGYVPTSTLSATLTQPTHRICAVSAMVYAEPSALSEPIMALSLGSRVSIRTEEPDTTQGRAGDEGVIERAEDRALFAELSSGGFVGWKHLTGPADIAPNFSLDFVAVAERFIGTPYIFGGKSALGIDCSGLVQVALAAAGICAPRDSDMQQNEIGRQISIGEDLSGLQRGDLVFWPGHVGLMANANDIVHANAANMQVTCEALSTVADRSRKTGPRLTAVRRLM